MVRLTQNSFFGGQLDFEMMGRQDFGRYAKGATKLCNFNILKRGSLDKRHGWDRIIDLKAKLGITADTKVRLIPFAFKKTQGFVVILTPLRMYVAETSPSNIYNLYSVTDGDNIYTSSEIDEIDYQQCGDVIFLAHQKHPPAKIEHVIDDLGKDGFNYSVLDLNRQVEGVPTISDALINRAAVNATGGTYTEEYKVTAMFDGQETYPCSAYRDTNCVNNAASWHGTTYYLPWTESQKIQLTINPKARVNKDGTNTYPDEIRIYKKAFNYFGLIGVKKLDYSDKLDAATLNAEYPNTKYENSDIGASVDLFSTKGVPNAYGRGATAYLFPQGKVEDDLGIAVKVSDWEFSDGGYYLVSFASGTWTLKKDDNTVVATKAGAAGDTKVEFQAESSSIVATKIGATKSGYVTMSLGSAYYTIAEDGESVDFYYKGWTATGLIAKFNGGSQTVETQLPASAGDRHVEVQKLDGESDDAFLTRWKDEFSSFCDQLRDATSINVRFAQADDESLFDLEVEVVGGDVVVNNIRVYREAKLESFTFDDKYITPSSEKTPPEYDEGSRIFDGDGNYPAAVSITQQRLVWASTEKDPARIWLSQVGDFYTYSPHEVQVADDPIDFIMPVTRFAKINHIAEMRKLLMFNSACEWLVDSASSVSGITYETIQAYPQSYSGSSERLKPIICNNSLVFCERTGQSVRRFAYDISNDGFAGRDMSVLSYSIFENNPIVDWTYQQFPFSTLWCVLADGSAASFEYMEEQDIMAWATHKLGGDGKFKAIATSYSVAPALDEIVDTEAYANATQEEVFAVVTHGSEIWLERMRVKCKSVDSVYHALCMDSVRILNSLNGDQPLDDPKLAYIPKDTVDGKPITKEQAVAKLADGVEVYEGYLFDAEYVSVFPLLPYSNYVGNGQMDIKNITNVGIRLMPSFGGTIHSFDFDRGDIRPEPIRYDDNPSNDCSPKFENGVAEFKACDCANVKPEGLNTRDGRVVVKQGDAWPFGVLMYEIDIETENGGYNGRGY